MGLSLGVITGMIVIIILLFFSALVSGSEVAFFSLRPSDLNQLEYREGKMARSARELIQKPESLLATILIANNFVNVGIVILATWISHNLMDFSGNPVLGFIIQTILITFLILLIGEIIPKVYATRHRLRFSLFMALPIQYLAVIFKPVAVLLIKATSMVQKRLEKRKGQINLNDLSQALELTGEELHGEEHILKGIVKFGNTDVKEVMKSRLDIVAVELKTTFAELRSIIINSGVSRIPVYENDFDHIHGILFVKDLLPHYHKGNSFRWQSLIRPPYFVPGNKKIDNLLEEFQKNKVHLALVVDEYGGTSGLITLEDILEEIVGEISDESDEIKSIFQKIDNQTFVFEGKVPLNDFYRALDLEVDAFEKVRGESDSLAGLILEIKGEMPMQGEVITFAECTFEVMEVDQRRISKVKVRLPEGDHEK